MKINRCKQLTLKLEKIKKHKKKKLTTIMRTRTSNNIFRECNFRRKYQLFSYLQGLKKKKKL